MPKSRVAFKSKVDRLDGNVYLYCLDVPAKIVVAFGGGFKRRYSCALSPVSKKGRKIEFSCSIMPRGNGRGFVMLSKKRMSDAGVALGDRPKVLLVVDESRHGMPVPAEWKALLKQDALGRGRFEALTPGKRRYVLHFVGGVKNPALRLERAMKVMENLKRLPPGGGTYREMFGIEKQSAASAQKTARRKDLSVIDFSDLVGERRPKAEK